MPDFVRWLAEEMNIIDRRVRRTHKLLHDALISLLLKQNYDSITVQDILDRADVGRSTFYTHFDDKDELLISGTDELRATLLTAVERERRSEKRHEGVIAFSRAMFEHASGYREVYHALLHTSAWPVVRERLQKVLDEIIRREAKTEIVKLRQPESDIPVDLFVHYLNATFFAVLTWWLDRRSRLTPAQIDERFRCLVVPTVHAVLG
jgi:AcrR family transcriptional regulator